MNEQVSALDIGLTSLKAVMKVYLLAAAGFYLCKRDFLPIDTSRAVSKINFNMLLPSLLFCNVTLVMGRADASTFGVIVLVLTLQFVLYFAMGWPVVRLLKPPRDFRGGLLASITFGNSGDLVFAVVSVACAGPPFAAGSADVAAGLVSIYMSISTALMFIFGDSWIASDYEEEEATETEPRLELQVSLPTEDQHHAASTDVMVADHSHDILQPHPENEPGIVVDDDDFDDATQLVHIKEVNGFENTIPKPASMRRLSSRKNKQPWWRVALQKSYVLVSPPNIAIVFGLIAGGIGPIRSLLVSDSTDVAPLKFLFDTLALMGGAAVPLGLMLLGASLARLTLKPAVKLSIVSAVVIIRLILLPVFSLLIVYTLAYVIKMPGISDPVLQFILIMEGMTPTASSIVMFELLHGGDGRNVASLMLPQYILAVVVIGLGCFATLSMIEAHV